MGEGLKALGKCAVGALIGGGATLNPLGAVGGCLIAQAVDCGGGDKTLPPLPSVGGKADGGQTFNVSADAGASSSGVRDAGGHDASVGDDGGRDSGVTPVATDAGRNLDGGTSVVDSGSPRSVDAGHPVGDHDAGANVIVADAGASTSADAGTPPPVAETWESFCHVIGADDVGNRYIALLNGEASRLNGNTDIVYGFAGASGTDATLVTQRQENSASTWPKDGQTIPDFAQNLVARYQVSISPQLQMTLRGYDVASVAQGAAIFPMTWESADHAGEPEAIASDTTNEIYPASDVPVALSVSCAPADASCHKFSGTLQSTLVSGGLQTFVIQCE